MKKIIFPVLAVLSLSFFGCEQDGLNVNFDLPYSTEVTLEAALVGGEGVPVDVTSPAVNTSSEALGENSTSLEKLNSATLNSLKVSIVAPDGQDFSFVKEVKLYIKGKDMTEELVAVKTNIDGTATVVEMDVEADVDLVEHIKSGEFVARASVTTLTTIENDVNFKIDLDMEVSAYVVDL